MKLRQMDVMADFFRAIRIKIIRKNEAYLLHHLLDDIKTLSEENGIEPVISNTTTLKRKIIEELGDEIGLFPTGRYVVVHNPSINPCTYSVATLQGHCLKDEDFIRSFANFFRRKLKTATFNALLEDYDSLQDRFKDGPLPELYNVIYATMYQSLSINEHGYAKTDSNNIATKIWSIALDWQTLITRIPNAKQAMLGLTSHCLTGSKEAAQTLHKFGHSISYNDILRYNTLWPSSQTPVHWRFSNVKSLHSSIDNNDG